MKIDVLTIFPELFEPFLKCSIVGRARQRGLLEVAVHNLRDYATDRHRTVDDTPYGGGPGMVMKPEPWFAALRDILGGDRQPSEVGAEVVLLTPAGKRLDQTGLEEFSHATWLILLCGRYEGIDDRVRERWATAEISIGDFVLGGGELAAQVLIEGVTRLLPGAIGDPESALQDSYASGLLDHRHFTKPADFEGRSVPEILLSGNHEQIRLWRLRDALALTLSHRPDILEKLQLTQEQKNILREMERSDKNSGALLNGAEENDNGEAEDS
jgi:tRNA (guanine37-N1)-methyltransferase